MKNTTSINNLIVELEIINNLPYNDQTSLKIKNSSKFNLQKELAIAYKALKLKNVS